MGVHIKKLTGSEVGVNDQPKGALIDPFISTLGVKMNLNSVKMPVLTPRFPLHAPK